MSDYNRISELASRISNLLEAVGNNNGEFTALDKDLSTKYIRELYEMVLAVRPVATAPVSRVNDRPLVKEKSEEIKPWVSNELSAIQKKEMKSVEESASKELPKLTEIQLPVNSSVEQKTENKPVHEAKKTAEAGSKKTISELYADKPETGKGTLNEKYKSQGKMIADNLKQTPIKDLKAYIGLNKRFTLINSLFKGNEQTYEEAIAKVNSLPNYEEAIKYIQDHLVNKLEWKDDDFMVSEFFMLVMRRYLR